MTPDELLEPRYIVLSDYPHSKFTVGEILQQSEITGWQFSDYPKIFSELVWYHYRDEKDMPLYVKCASSENHNHVEKVMEWLRDYSNNKTLISGFLYQGSYKTSERYPEQFYNIRMSLMGWFPATEEEYLEFKSKK